MKVSPIRPETAYVSKNKISEERKENVKTTDKLELSYEAMGINPNILAKIKSGFYNSKEVRDVVVDKILKDI